MIMIQNRQIIEQTNNRPKQHSEVDLSVYKDFRGSQRCVKSQNKTNYLVNSIGITNQLCGRNKGI